MTVIAEPCMGTKDTACVDACRVDCIHPKKNTTYDDARPGFDEVPNSLPLTQVSVAFFSTKEAHRFFIVDVLRAIYDSKH